jgi:hypothetical protein
MSTVLLQGWRLSYYGSGIVGLIITLLTAFTLREPERQAIGEENDANANAAVVRADEDSTRKSGQWKVMLQPRVIMLCLAASIRHTGKHLLLNVSWYVFIVQEYPAMICGRHFLASLITASLLKKCTYTVLK